MWISQLIGDVTAKTFHKRHAPLMVENVAGTKCREFFLATFATLSTIFCSFCYFRDIKYPRLLNVRYLAAFNTRDIFYSRLFHFWLEKSWRHFIFIEIFVKIGLRCKKTRSMVRDIRVENKQFVYQNCFSSNNKLRIPESTGIMNLQERNAPPFRGLPLDGCYRASGPPHWWGSACRVARRRRPHWLMISADWIDDSCRC